MLDQTQPGQILVVLQAQSARTHPPIAQTPANAVFTKKILEHNMDIKKINLTFVIGYNRRKSSHRNYLIINR